jgi:predicted GIY-YIG superfamily endonuclease
MESTPITRKTSGFILVNPNTIDIDIDIEPKTIPRNRFYEPSKPFWLYVLKLENNRYYVGSTSQTNPYDRIMQHVNKDGGAKWTELYAPIEVIEIRDAGTMTRTQAEAYERNLTWEYMRQYGVNKVRGGIFNSPERLWRVGRNRVLTDYAASALFFTLLCLLAVVYILLRHIFNWW